MYKKCTFSGLTSCLLRGGDAVPPVLGFGEDTQFEAVEQLQSPACVAALLLPVSRC